ncbi:hypothetical protein LTS15_009495 [Exophiala xenobiotica]|nr:hypothetical protein LTS15_009495 [Exophiala xenobiotica]
MSQIENLSSLASLPSPLPPAPDGEILTKDQFNILFSILEVTLPSISAGSNGSKNTVSSTQLDTAISRLRPYLPDGAPEGIARAYLSEDITSDPAFRETIIRKIKLFIPPSDVQGLGFILSALNTTVGSYVLTGYSAPIHTHDLATRTHIVHNWASARFPLLRGIYRSMNGLARMAWIATSPTLLRMLDFPRIPKHIERNDSYAFTFHDFTSSSTPTVTLSTDVVIIGSGCGAGVVASHLARAGLKCLVLEKSYHFPSTHFPMSTSPAGEHLMENGGIITSDDASIVVLAGSTFGGGGTVNWSASLQPQYAVRQEWAASSDGGLPHFLSPEFQDCLDTVCDKMGVARTTDPSTLAHIEHNFANATLLEGARRLGMAVEVVPQNSAGRRHFCGYCTYGCASTTKQGPANCWLPDAAQHGAEFIEGAFVEEVVIDPKSKVATGVRATWTPRSSHDSHSDSEEDRSKASTRETRTLLINAKRVILAAGTLHSPLILQRSGLKNPHIGSNLHLHPTGQVWSVWPHRVNPWEGSILTVAVTELDNRDGAHHGPKLEVVCSTPGFGLLGLPFRTTTTNNDLNFGCPSTKDTKPSAEEDSKGDSKDRRNTSIFAPAIEYKLNAAKHAYSTGFISITRDADTGKVYIDPKDPLRKRPRIAYTPSARDRRHILEGQIAAAKISFVMGANEIDTAHPGVKRWIRPSTLSSSLSSTNKEATAEQDAATTNKDATAEQEDEASSPSKKEDEENEDSTSFTSWLSAVRTMGLTAPDPCTLGSAHQMGTCRMSSSPHSGVVDSQGKVWGIEGLYVADASVFPSASGVNPMITNMGIAEWISKGISRDWKGERERERKQKRPSSKL